WQQLRGRPHVCRRESERVSASGSDLDTSANSVAGALQQAIGDTEFACGDEPANPRARNASVVVDYVRHRNETDRSSAKILLHQQRVAGALVTEPKRRSDRDRTHAQLVDEKVEKLLRR